MNIENLIISLMQSSQASSMLDQKDFHFIVSLSKQLYNNVPLTEKQANLSIAILKRHRLLLNSILRIDVDPFLKNPTFNAPFRVLSKVKSLSIAEHPKLGKVIQLECPYSEELIKNLRNNKPSDSFSEWDPVQRVWNFGISESNILFLTNIISSHEFEINQEIEDLISQTNEIVGNIDRYVPLLVSENGAFHLKNVSPLTPTIKSTDTLDALFEARRLGISTWEEKIDEQLKNSKVNQITIDFLNNDPGNHFLVDSRKIPIDHLGDIIQRMTPCMIIIPSGDELSNITLVYNLLKSVGFEDKEISVTFRLDNTPYGLNFNYFVKTNFLNSPVSHLTKAVLINEKIKKDVIKAKKRYNCVLNLGIDSAHYTLLSYIENRPNLITYIPNAKDHKKNHWLSTSWLRAN